MSSSAATAVVRFVLASDGKRRLYGEHPAAPGPTCEFDRIEHRGPYLVFLRRGLEVNRCRVSGLHALEIVKDAEAFEPD